MSRTDVCLEFLHSHASEGKKKLRQEVSKEDERAAQTRRLEVEILREEQRSIDFSIRSDRTLEMLLHFG